MLFTLFDSKPTVEVHSDRTTKNVSAQKLTQQIIRHSIMAHVAQRLLVLRLIMNTAMV